MMIRHVLARIRAVAACGISALTMAMPVAQAGDYPDRQVRLIVPQAPGGASDFLAGLIAQGLTQMWGQTVVVDNRAGAGGDIGLEATARSPADGYTLLLTYEATQAINGSLRNLSFDPVKDFTPIATVATVPFIVAVNKNIKANTFQEFVALARAHPGMTFGSAGSGSANHLLGEMVNMVADTKMVHIPYKGAAPAMTDLIGGRIDAVYNSVPSIAQQIDAGQVKGIAITSKARSARFPNLPTIAESGYPDFDVNPWFGIFGPANMPPAIVEKINRDVATLLDRPDVRKSLADQSAEPLKTTPRQLGDMLNADIKKWAVVVQKSGAKSD